MLSGEAVAVYCENHTEHTHTVRISGNTLRLRDKAQPVNSVCGDSRCLLWEPYGTNRYSSYLTGNTVHLHYKDKPVNVVWGNSRYL
jgi:hypothetical protein